VIGDEQRKQRMPQIRFSIEVDTEDEESSRVIRKIDGTVFEYAGESDKEKQIAVFPGPAGPGGRKGRESL
jgi:hypothetical protein